MDTVIQVTHDCLIFGRFPADKIREVSSNISVVIQELPRFQESVTITLKNTDDEDVIATVFTLGKLVGQLLTISKR